jgi:hypothetical protein
MEVQIHSNLQRLATLLILAAGAHEVEGVMLLVGEILAPNLYIEVLESEP